MRTTRQDHELIRQELARILVEERERLAAMPSLFADRGPLLLRVELLQQCYDIWCQELLPC